MLFSKTIALVYSWLSLLTTSNVQLRLATCNGLRNPENFCLWNPECGKICLWNPESGKILLVESGLLGFGIRNPTINWNPDIQNPSSTDKYWNPVIVIRNPQRGVQNPRLSWIPSHGAIRGQ